MSAPTPTEDRNYARERLAYSPAMPPIIDGAPMVTPTAPPVGPLGLAMRCAVQGADAYHAGAPVLACPYGATRPYSRRAWLVGYVGAARAAGAVLPGDPELEDALDEAAPWPGDAPAEVSAP